MSLAFYGLNRIIAEMTTRSPPLLVFRKEDAVGFEKSGAIAPPRPGTYDSQPLSTSSLREWTKEQGTTCSFAQEA